jgi:3-deoxy-D-manno-octulosonic-acid transferase
MRSYKPFFSCYKRTDGNCFQVSGKLDLLEMLKELLGESKALAARHGAARDAFSIMSDGVVNRVWNLICRSAINL